MQLNSRPPLCSRYALPSKNMQLVEYKFSHHKVAAGSSDSSLSEFESLLAVDMQYQLPSYYPM